MLRRLPSLTLAFLTCLWISNAAGGVEPTYKNEKYDTKHERNVLDFWKAESSKPTPVVVYFHGGGFVQGDKGQIPSRAIIKKYLDAGVSFASCNYPFIKNQSPAEYTKVMRHCGRAIQFLRSMSKGWNIDQKRFGAIGASAGALISEWLGYGPESPQSGEGGEVFLEGPGGWQPDAAVWNPADDHWEDEERRSAAVYLRPLHAIR